MTLLLMPIAGFCVGLLIGRARERRRADREAARLAAEQMDAYRCAPKLVEIFVADRPILSAILEESVYHVANVDALIALGSRATTGGV